MSKIRSHISFLSLASILGWNPAASLLITLAGTFWVKNIQCWPRLLAFSSHWMKVLNEAEKIKFNEKVACWNKIKSARAIHVDALAKGPTIRKYPGRRRSFTAFFIACLWTNKLTQVAHRRGSDSDDDFHPSINARNNLCQSQVNDYWHGHVHNCSRTHD
jgi:hypothetical protein